MNKILLKIKWSNIKTYIIAHKIISIVIILLLILGSFIISKLFTSPSTTQYVFGKVTKGDLVQSVSGTGQVATLSQVDIKPQTVGQSQTLGQIVSVNVQNGDFVKAGQMIAVLDGKNALQALNQAKASVAIAEANYNKLVNGPTSLDLESINNSIESGENTLKNTEDNIILKIKSTYTTVSADVYLNTDLLFDNLSFAPKLKPINGVMFTNQTSQDSVEFGRMKIGTLLDNFKLRISNSSTDVISDLKQTISDLNIFSNYFENMTMLFSNYSFTNLSASQTILNSDKTASNQAEVSINSAISDLTSMLQTYNNTELSLEQNRNNLTLKTASPSDTDLIVLKSNLDNAKANMENALSNYESRIIRAPFAGQVGGFNAQIGMQVSSNDSLGKIITQDKVVNITLNEVDAAKIGINNPVTLTFDAIPDLVLNGKIQYIDPLGNVNQGVVNYNVRVSISDKNEAIKAGMTASADISTSVHKDTLIVPSSAIKTIGNRKFILVADLFVQNFSTSSIAPTSNWKNFGTSSRKFSSSTRMSRETFANPAIGESSIKQVEVVVGISNGISTEILSGLEEGQTIVTKTTVAKTTTTTASTANANPFAKITGGGNGGATRSLSR